MGPGVVVTYCQRDLSKGPYYKAVNNLVTAPQYVGVAGTKNLGHLNTYTAPVTTAKGQGPGDVSIPAAVVLDVNGANAVVTAPGPGAYSWTIADPGGGS